MKNGLPIILSAPSGAGKSTMAQHIVKANRNARLSISCTTRPPRRGEVNGRDYHFIRLEEFKRRIQKKDFLEWARVHGHLYGTPKSYVTNALKQGKDVLLVIDVQGALSVKKHFPGGIFIFVITPSWDVLVKRLKERGVNSPQEIKLRLNNAKKELSLLPHFDYLVVNKVLKDAIDDVAAIIRAEHRRLGKGKGLSLSLRGSAVCDRSNLL